MTPAEFLSPAPWADYFDDASYDAATLPAADYAELNLTDAFCDKRAVRGFARRFLPPAYWLAFAAGAAGNGLVLLALGRRRRGGVRAPSDLFLLHLAAADLLLLATLPLWAQAAAGAGPGPLRAPACRALRAAYRASSCGCALLLACISVDRCAAVARARGAGPLGRRRRLACGRLACGAVWAAAALSCLPELLLSEAGPGPAAACALRFPRAAGARLKAAVLTLQAALGFLLPAAVMAACYALVLRTLARARRAARLHALKAAVAALTVFVASQLPYNLVLLVQAADAFAPFVASCAQAARLDVGAQVTQALAFAHSCLDPALYACAGQRSRRALLRALPRLRRARRGPASPGPASPGPSSTLLEPSSGPPARSAPASPGPPSSSGPSARPCRLPPATDH